MRQPANVSTSGYCTTSACTGTVRKKTASASGDGEEQEDKEDSGSVAKTLNPEPGCCGATQPTCPIEFLLNNLYLISKC
jgi:hypothetical protein